MCLQVGVCLVFLSSLGFGISATLGPVCIKMTGQLQLELLSRIPKRVGNASEKQLEPHL